MAKMSVTMYGAFAAVAYAIMFWWYGWDLFRPAPHWFFWSVVAFFAGLAVCWLSKVFFSGFRFAQQMEEEFINVLGPLTVGECAVIAASSAIGEESVFRGVLQPWLGIIKATIVFAAVHLPASQKLRAWPFFALAIGFLFAGLAHVSGSLIPPMVTHATINGLNLWLIGEKARQLGIPRREFPPDPDDV